MTRYVFGSQRFNPLESSCGGLRPSIQEVLDLIDTSDPAWPGVAATLREFVAAGIDISADTAEMAVKLARHRLAGEDELPDIGPAQPTLASGAPSIVYYVRRAELLKIGTTTVPHERFADLLPDEILAAEPGGRTEEVARHRQFRHLRRSGEYFQDAPELRDHIARVRTVHGDPDPSWPTVASLHQSRKVWRLEMSSSTETLTATEAEAKLGIKENTLRAWVHRGRLQVAGRDEQRRHLFYTEHLLALRDSTRKRMATNL